ncbi:hypothetical protein G6F62_008879 [Rhizopus arrhizus]|nr:hypothetical protein G6F28_006702 [Rhizopus arrhizus]KAG1090963.1 hypothetical protein G6F39_010219 [Rhizopus arrhizus]KAG1324827.1 hypothetical protein G6F62_008879 [Rhizopus arrhizus]
MIRKHSDFGYDAEQILLVIESILETKGHFQTKDYSTRLTKYSEHIKDFNHPNYITNPIVRAPILGALKFWDGTSVIENSASVCSMTHPDPRYIVSSVILSLLIARGQDLEIQLQPIPTPVHSPHLTSSFTDSLNTDPTLSILVRDVIETNKQNFQGAYMHSFFSLGIYPDYYQCLIACAKPETLGSLQLDSTEDVFRSLQAALYCFTRSIPDGQEPDYFKKIMMDLVLQGGNAESNATTAGALLGARLGYSQLPTEWVVGMKRWEWLEDRVDEFIALF